MDKVKVVALKTFEYGNEVKTDKSNPFEVTKSEFLFFESNGMVKASTVKQQAQNSEDSKPKNSGKGK